MRPLVLLLSMTMLVGCGGGAAASVATSASPGTVPASGQAAPPPANGSVDCTRIKQAAVQLLAVQFLAQLRTPDTIAAVKGKQIGDLDLDAFLAGMHDLHALDGYASALGDPKAAIDTYEDAANAAKVLFATEPMTQAAIDAYNAKVGTVGEFLSHQVAISAAIGAAGC